MSSRRLVSSPAPEPKNEKGAAFRPDPEAEPDTEHNPEGFNILAWAQGIRPIKRVVTLYQRLDLLADRDLAGSELRDAQLAGDEERAEELRAQVRELTDQIKASAVNIVLQGVTQSRFQEILEEAQRNKTVVTPADVLLYQMAAQIVEPAGLDWQTLKVIDDQMPVQAAKIGTAWHQINTAAPDVEASIPF